MTFCPLNWNKLRPTLKHWQSLLLLSVFTWIICPTIWIFLNVHRDPQLLLQNNLLTLHINHSHKKLVLEIPGDHFNLFFDIDGDNKLRHFSKDSLGFRDLVISFIGCLYGVSVAFVDEFGFDGEFDVGWCFERWAYEYKCIFGMDSDWEITLLPYTLDMWSFLLFLHVYGGQNKMLL